MKNWIGWSVIVIGLIHNMVGILFLRPVLLTLWEEGLLNTVHGEPMREFAFWFLFGGFAMLLIGALIHWIEQQTPIIPAFIGWSLIALALLVVAIMPLSGGWLMFVPAIGILYQQKMIRQSM